MTTPRQIAANQANSLKSCGPKTPETKARSRANALKHGLSGAGVVTLPDDTQAITDRLKSWRPVYVPVDDQQEWQFQQIVVSSVRIDRCQSQESAIRLHVSACAEVSWHDDRFAAAEELGAHISRNPALIVDRLRRTRQGCLWLSARWKRLGLLFQQDGIWTDAQKNLAMDLTGMPNELRDASLTDRPDILVTQQIKVQEKLLAESRDDLDEFEHEAAIQGLELTPSKSLTLLRRYEARCMKELKAASALLASRTPEQSIAPAPVEIPPAFIEATAVPIAKEPEPEPEPVPVNPPVQVPRPLYVPTNPIRMVSALAEVPRSLNRHQRRAAESLARG